MGYSHYWTRSDFEISEADWKKITDDVRKIVAKSPATLTFEYDDAGPPVVDMDFIRFNGVGNNGHETFLIERSVPEDERMPRYESDDRKWSFCKTAMKPYDVTVTAILAYLDSVWPKLFKVSSDGDASDWAKGLHLAAEALPDHTVTAPRELMERT